MACIRVRMPTIDSHPAHTCEPYVCDSYTCDWQQFTRQFTRRSITVYREGHSGLQGAAHRSIERGRGVYLAGGMEFTREFTVL